MKNRDVVVIGGGPAGSSAAAVLAEAGADVLLIERSRHPRKKACGGLLSPKALLELDHVFGPDVLDGISTTKHSRGAIYQGLNHLVTTEVDPPFVMIKREEFDKALFDRAVSSGADSVQGVTAIPDIENGTVEIPDGTIRAKFVIIAHGKQNTVAKRYAWGRPPDGIAFVTTIPSSFVNTGVDGPIVSFFDDCRGYAWLFPNDDVTNMGTGGVTGETQQVRIHGRDWMEHWAPGVEYRFVAHHFSCGSINFRPVRNNMLLTGEAAGIGDPITGEGICHAMASGRFAAMACLDVLEGRSEFLAGSYMKRLGPMLIDLQAGQAMSDLLYAPVFRDSAQKALSREEAIADDFAGILSGKRGYIGFALKLAARLAPHAGAKLLRGVIKKLT